MKAFNFNAPMNFMGGGYYGTYQMRKEDGTGVLICRSPLISRKGGQRRSDCYGGDTP